MYIIAQSSKWRVSTPVLSVHILQLNYLTSEVHWIKLWEITNIYIYILSLLHNACNATAAYMTVERDTNYGRFLKDVSTDNHYYIQDNGGPQEISWYESSVHDQI